MPGRRRITERPGKLGDHLQVESLLSGASVTVPKRPFYWESFLPPLFPIEHKLPMLMCALGAVGLLAFFAPDGQKQSSPGPQDASTQRNLPTGRAENKTGGDSIGSFSRATLSVQGVAELFGATSWLPPTAPVVAPKPVAPSFPFHFVGSLIDSSGIQEVYLARHGSGVIVTPKVSDILDQTFLVERIGSDKLDVVYLPLKERISIAFSSLGPEPGTRSDTSSGAVGAALSSAILPAASDPGRQGSSVGVMQSLPAIAGLPIATVGGVAASPGSAGTSSTPVSATSAGSSASPSAAGGSSPLSPSNPPQGVTLGGAAPSGTLGSAPASNGVLGTPPTAVNNSALFGPKPTSGGPPVN